MTWNEICDELVKRWPNRFKRGDGDLILANDTGSVAAYIIEPPNLDDIDLICTIIGAVVFSSPIVPQCEYWRAMYYCASIPKCEYHGDVYYTRAEAELAALGAWLEVTR